MSDIETIEANLPNGFHDAKLLEVTMKCDRGEVVMTIDADLSDPDASESGERAYRRGELHVSGLAFLSMDVPRVLFEPKPLRISSGSGQPSTSPVMLPSIPDGCFLHWFFVNEWNGFIRVAARSAEFRWSK